MANITGSLDVLSILIAFISALLGVLIVLLAWIGSRLHNRLDSISNSLEAIETDLRKDFTALDRRVNTIETLEELRGNAYSFKSKSDTGRRSRKSDTNDFDENK